MARTLTSTESTVPDELGCDTKRTRDTEEDSVEVHLVETVVGQEHTGVRVDVRPGVLRLTGLEEDAGDDVVHLGDELEERITRQMLEREFALRGVARVGLAQNGVAVAGHDLAALESRPDVLAHGVVSRVLADLRLHLTQPDEDLLVGKTVKGSSETVQRCTKGEERVRKRRADKLASVGGHITAFVIRVNGNVETQELDKLGLVSVAEELGEVVRVVLVRLDGRELAPTVDVAEDTAGDGRKLGNPVVTLQSIMLISINGSVESAQVHSILEGGRPVLLLGDTLLVGLGKCRIMVELIWK